MVNIYVRYALYKGGHYCWNQPVIGTISIAGRYISNMARIIPKMSTSSGQSFLEFTL